MLKSLRWLGVGALVLAAGVATQIQADGPAKPARPQVEVVFCLDTTGSMGGLINAAKQKIWAICNQISTGNPTPQVKVGLVAFRDRGDVYITKITDLTDDLDAIHTELMSFQAQGGGDTPESVNQALHESVTKINWSKNKKTLKIIFLVGDAPPHMNYADDVKYPDSCKLAVKNDIIINTIQCGTHAETKKYWVDICRLAEGSYVQIDQKGGPVVVVATPFDDKLAKINTEISKAVLIYGDQKRQQAGFSQQKANLALPKAAAADRAAFYGNSARGASYCLLEAVKNKTVKLEDLKKDELPEELKKLNLQQQREYLDKLDKRRTELNTQAKELDKKRSGYIAQKQREDEKNRGRDSFDNQVLNILQRQANRANIQYALPEQKK